MRVDTIPVWVLFVGTILLVKGSIELGYRLGRMVRRRSEDEKESPVSAIAGSVLGLVAFMLAFTFGIVTERYETRKGLVREEANTIRTTWSRTDFLPEPDRTEAKALLREYLANRLPTDQSLSARAFEEKVRKVLAEEEGIQRRLWDMAVVNARKDMDSDVAALYVDSLNQVAEVHASRVAIALQQRIPVAIWVVLWSLTFFGMAALGYQTGIAGSKRSLAQPLLAVSFSMVVALIASLDRPVNSFVKVSQQPLIDLYNSMTSSDGGAKQRTNQSSNETSQ
jgi:hypothetical protein